MTPRRVHSSCRGLTSTWGSAPAVQQTFKPSATLAALQAHRVQWLWKRYRYLSQQALEAFSSSSGKCSELLLLEDTCPPRSPPAIQVQCAGARSKVTRSRHRLFSSCYVSQGPSAQRSLHAFTKENRWKHHIICGCSSADAPFAHYNLWAVLWNDLEGWEQSALLSSGIWR